MPDRYADTKVDATGRRVPAADVEDASGPSRLSVSEVPGDTQIAADGSRVPVDQVADIAAPRNAESLFREQRAAAPGTPVAEDDEPDTDPESEPDADADGDSEDDGDLESKNKAQLLEMAADLEIDGRSTMNKDELIEAIRAAQ